MTQPATKEFYENVARMRISGMTFSAIAEVLDMPVNTIKSIWRRYELKREAAVVKCEFCGTELNNPPKVKPKKFCSAKCRSRWWYQHREDSPALSRRTCIGCGKPFVVRGGQKFCSLACYHKNAGGTTDEQGDL